MLSDLSRFTLPFDTPALPDSMTEDPPLNFDDLLDIAHEIEFTRTITHIWPCEEEPNACPETGLDDFLAAIMPAPTAEELDPLPLPGSAMSTIPGSVQVQEADWHGSASSPNTNMSKDTTSFSRDDDQVRAGAVEPPIALMLQGWSPPDGSPFFDLDDSLLFPQSLKDIRIPPWLATFLAFPCAQPASTASQPSAIIPLADGVQEQMAAMGPEVPPASTTNKAVNDSGKKTVPLVPLPLQPSACTILEPALARSNMGSNPKVQSSIAVIPHTKTPRSRPQLTSTPQTGGALARYAKAPRGGIPPHIARTVTRANMLRVEKERKVVQNAFSTATAGEVKKPSVLRRTAKVERGTGKPADGNDTGKKQFSLDENGIKEARTAKRARV